MPNQTGNQSHASKEKLIAVEPIRKIKDIKLIKTMLKDNPRDLAIFVLGINTNLRASDILNIRVHQVIEAQAGDELTLNEIKTKKPRRINCVPSVGLRDLIF